ncbi:META domain-containing protein [Rhizocola hellebori]|uniref:META domain-containing protein n=1 Tax=Rhizocola hellebori TaxID=1392758 RepID=A0A8J3Q511_9ACTN|nr:META domain-containing protein [Rhizocola hellebori]GIH03944.1 META domain-containing protein [Rhizocola hellebori]
MIMRSGLAVTLLVLSACSGLGGGAGSQFVGRTFLSTEVTGHTLADSTRLQLAFPEAGKLTAQAGCNHLFGDVSFDGDHMKVAEMGSTTLGCDEARHKQDAWLSAFLKAGPKFTVNGDELVLTGETETIKLVDKSASQPDKPLQGTKWMVQSLVDGQSAGSVPQGTPAFLRFDGETVTGDAGCNQLSGKAVQTPGAITFSDLKTTKKACAGDGAAVEAAMLGALSGQVTAKIDGDLLELRNANGKGLQLRAAP